MPRGATKWLGAKFPWLADRSHLAHPLCVFCFRLAFKTTRFTHLWNRETLQNSIASHCPNPKSSAWPRESHALGKSPLISFPSLVRKSPRFSKQKSVCEHTTQGDERNYVHACLCRPKLGDAIQMFVPFVWFYRFVLVTKGGFAPNQARHSFVAKGMKKLSRWVTILQCLHILTLCT